MKLISNALSLFIIIALAVMWLHSQPKQHTARDLSEDDLFCMVQNGVSADRLDGCGHILVQKSKKRSLSLIAS
jgi:hypothetical protein